MPRAFCPACGTVRQCRAFGAGLAHVHKERSLWFGVLETPVRAYVNEQQYRILQEKISYYDLIELPTGGHAPVPMAIKLIGAENVIKVPLCRTRKRDGAFFHCDQCFGDGLSFYKCKLHHAEGREEYNHAKEVYLLALRETGKLKSCRYVRAVHGKDGWRPGDGGRF